MIKSSELLKKYNISLVSEKYSFDIFQKDKQKYYNKLKSIIRIIKIDSLNDSTKYDNIYLQNIPLSDKIILKKLSRYGIICGSTALRLYGLITRDSNDFDIIVSKEMLEKISKKHHINKSPIYSNVIINRCVGTIRILNKKIDLFIDESEHDLDLYNISFIESNNLKIQNLDQVIFHKADISMSREKRVDPYDIHDIIFSMENNTRFIQDESGMCDIICLDDYKYTTSIRKTISIFLEFILKHFYYRFNLI